MPPAEARSRSPYEVALGDVEFARLDPTLQRYFAAIPPAQQGVGRGIFDRAGSRHAVHWPLFALLRLLGVAFPGDHRSIPFLVINRHAASAGATTVVAARRFGFPRGKWTMHDRTFTEAGLIVDDLGRAGLIRVRSQPAVVDGGLHLQSVEASVRIGRVHLRVPSSLAPRVRLREQAHPSGDQLVSVSVTFPVLGTVFGYSGRFRYSLEPR